MSRIYQGGGADRRFQSNKQSRDFSPKQVQSNVNKIKQAGIAAIRDLQTQDRERQRANQMSDLERNTADRFAEAQLKQEQIQEAAAFKIQQTVDDFNLKNTQLDEQQRLVVQQTADKGKFEIQQLGERSEFQYDQLVERNDLQRDIIQENLDLGLKRLETQANAQREQAAMNAQFAQQNANLAKQQAAVSALLSFADIAIKGAELGIQWKEQQDKDAKEQQDRADFQEFLTNASLPKTVTTAEANQNAIEIADEQAIQKYGANSIQREHMRQPLADQTMLRDIQQTEIGIAANQFQPQFDAYINDPNTRALVNGEMRTLNSLNDRELFVWLQSAAADLSVAYGITGKESYAAVMQYKRAVVNSINAQHNSLAKQLRAVAKKNRFDATVANATQVVLGGDYQRGYDLLRRGLETSGLADRKSITEINDAALSKLIEITPTEQLDQLNKVLKNSVQSGTEFGNQPKYKMMIQDAIKERNSSQYGAWNSAQQVTSISIKTIEQEVQRELFNAGPEADARAIREAGIQQLLELRTPQAFDAINRLREKEGLNPTALAELNEAFDYGNPPSTESIMDAYYRGAISHQQKENLLKRGKTSTEIFKVLTSSGLPDAEIMLDSVVASAIGSMPSKMTTEASRLLKQTTIRAELNNYKNELNRIVINNPDAPASVIQQKVQELNNSIQKRLYDPIKPDSSVFQREGSIYSYKFGSAGMVAPYRLNEYTGRAHRSYINFTVDQIYKHAKDASVLDVYLTPSQFEKAVEVWDSNGSDYDPRIKAIAKHLGIGPAEFVKRQSYALGYGQIERLPKNLLQLDSSSTSPSMKQGFQALQSLGFPAKGAAYLSGNIQQESGWNGRRTWPEVMNDGSDRNGGLVSWMDDAQRNHFRLRNIEQYLGKPITDASTSEQLQAMVWEMKRRNPSAYRVFMNPNSTDIQLRRASREYWGYGHEGSRYDYALSLLR